MPERQKRNRAAPTVIQAPRSPLWLSPRRWDGCVRVVRRKLGDGKITYQAQERRFLTRLMPWADLWQPNGDYATAFEIAERKFKTLAVREKVVAR